MKTVIFGALMGLFGVFAVYISITFGWPGWILFLAWVCFYLYGKTVKKSLNIYLQIVLGIVLSILMDFFGGIFSETIGEIGFYLSIFLFVGSLAFLIKIKGLHDLTAWFFGFIVYFGIEPELGFVPIVHQLLLPLAIGFALGYVVDQIVVNLVYGRNSSANH